MQKRKFFEWPVEVEEQVYDMAGWDLPGLKSKRVQGRKAGKPESQNGPGTSSYG